MGFSVYSIFSLVSPNYLTRCFGVLGLLQKSYKEKERVIIKLLKFKIGFFFCKIIGYELDIVENETIF